MQNLTLHIGRRLNVQSTPVSRRPSLRVIFWGHCARSRELRLAAGRAQLPQKITLSEGLRLTGVDCMQGNTLPTRKTHFVIRRPYKHCIQRQTDSLLILFLWTLNSIRVFIPLGKLVVLDFITQTTYVSIYYITFVIQNGCK